MLNHLMVSALPLVPKDFVKVFASPYVAGETMADMVKTVQALNADTLLSTVDLLGEFIDHPSQAKRTADIYLQVLEAIHTEGLNANISVKLTALGLLLDPPLCKTLMEKLIQKAAVYNNFVRIDMEDSDCTEATIDLYLALRQKYQNVGIVLQAYLHRTYADTVRILDAGAGHFRLCKGIYVEPREIAYQLPDLINQNYLDVLELMLSREAYVGIATHDERLVWGAKRLIRQYKRSPEHYEFQMLLGVDSQLRDMLLAEGHRVRVYVPYGREWYAYCMRRLKENPKIMGYLLQNLFQKTTLETKFQALTRAF